jgi:hypothetical protein
MPLISHLPLIARSSEASSSKTFVTLYTRNLLLANPQITQKPMSLATTVPLFSKAVKWKTTAIIQAVAVVTTVMMTVAKPTSI